MTVQVMLGTGISLNYRQFYMECLLHSKQTLKKKNPELLSRERERGGVPNDIFSQTSKRLLCVHG